MSDNLNEGEKTKTNGGNGGKLGQGRFPRLNRYYEALAHPYRRYTLYYLNEHRDETIALDELAKQVTAVETTYSPETLLDDECTHVRYELYHNHLPRLADYGIIDFDPRSKDVRFHHPSRKLVILLWASQLIERTP